MLAAVAMLNVEFNTIGIFFKYRGTDFIKSSNYRDTTSLSNTHFNVISLFEGANLIMDNAINVYIANGVGNFGFDRKIWLDPVNFASGNSTEIAKRVILHETGHVLKLLHTWYDQDSFADISTNRPLCHKYLSNETYLNVLKKPVNNGILEAVTRDPANPNYNADIAGDWVADTDACFRAIRNNYCRNEYIDPVYGPQGVTKEYLDWIEDPRVTDHTRISNTSVYYCFNTFTKYSYTAGNTFYSKATNGVDQTSNNLVTTNIPLGTNSWQNIIDTALSNCTSIDSGETYKCDNNLIYNYMHNEYNELRNKFTPGQKQRMRESLLGNFGSGFNYVNFALALNEDGTADITCLYEPFAVDSHNGNANGVVNAYSRTYSPAPNNTGANVWNCGPFNARFQTGFDSEFTNVSGQTVSQSPYQQYNVGLNDQIGVKIPILSQDIHYTTEPLCFGSFEPYISGDIKSQNFIGSSYYTIEELDKIKATNPDLYNQLQSGQYHIITKETESGYKNQSIIFKN